MKNDHFSIKMCFCHFFMVKPLEIAPKLILIKDNMCNYQGTFEFLSPGTLESQSKIISSLKDRAEICLRNEPNPSEQKKLWSR